MNEAMHTVHTKTVQNTLCLPKKASVLSLRYHKTLEDRTEVVEPATAAPYLDRSKSFPYKIEKGDLCHKLFTENGFEWGGEWTTVKDYQHFELIEE